MNNPVLENNLERVLSVSTVNIRENDAALMDSEQAPYRMMRHDKGYGVLFDCASPDMTDSREIYTREMKDFGFSPEFIRILTDAHDTHFDRVYLDRDADPLPDSYPTFEW